MLELQGLHGQLALLAALMAATAVCTLHSPFRKIIASLAMNVVNSARIASSWVAALYDAIVPIDQRNGRLPPLRLGLWAGLNLIVASLAFAAPYFIAFRELVMAAELINATLVCINLLFLVGAYWALREGIDIMNGDMAYGRRLFKKDPSAAKSLPVICCMSLVLWPQIAALMHGLQIRHEVMLIALRSDWPDWVSFLVAVVNALPFASLYVRIPGLANQTMYTAPIGALGYAILNTVGSVLIVSTIIGFVQQHMALRRMIYSLRSKTDTTLVPLLQRRFLRAPSAIKAYVLAALRQEGDDALQLKLMKMAMDRHTYSFPEFFIRRYRFWGQEAKLQGAALLAEFITTKGGAFDRETLIGVATAARRAVETGAISGREELQRLAAILLPVIEHLGEPKNPGSFEAREAMKITRHLPILRTLSALLHDGTDEDMRKRAGLLILEAKAKDALPEILRCLQYMAEDTRILILGKACELLADRGINFGGTGEKSPLAEMIRTVDWNTHNVQLTPPARKALSQLRAALVAKQRPVQPAPLPVDAASAA